MGIDNNFAEVSMSPEFEAAWKAVIERPVTREEFLEMPMPPGVEAQDLWAAFARLRRHMGVTLDLPPWFKGSYGNASWYALSKQEEQRLTELTSLAAPDSRLNELLDDRKIDSISLSGHLLDELASLARHDGLFLSTEQIREVWLQQRKAASRAELVVQNAAHIFDNARKFASRSFSRMLMDDVHELLLDGVGNLELQSIHMFSEGLYDFELMADPNYQSDVADAIVRFARDAHSAQEVAMRSALTAFYFWDMQPYPTLNRFTEFLVRRIYFMHNRMPALSFARFSRGMEFTARTYSRTHEVEASGTAQEGLDATWLFAGAIETFLSEAKELDALARRLEQEQRRFQAQLKNASNLNARQKAFLTAVQRTRRREYTLHAYQEYFKVAYATARSDMLELVDMGILTYQKEGKAFVFRLAGSNAPN